jgi:SAM-dependent methyltransferase
MAATYPSPGRPQRLVFGEVADTYEAVRPGYPAEVFDLVLSDGRRDVVEVGAGTGKATGPLLERGARVDAVEPSAEMARVLQAKFPGAPLRVLACGIEDALTPGEGGPLTAGAADVVFAAQAWHWVDPERGTAAAHRLLRPDGVIALCWNHPAPTPSAGDLRAHLDEVYEREAPDLAVREPGLKGRDITDGSSPHGRALAQWFGPAAVHEQPWSARYDAAGYTALLATQSDHRLLAPARLERLLAAIAEAVEARGGIEVGYVCRLVLAHPR